MAPPPRLVTAQELDEMSPNERAAAFEERIVPSLDRLPAEFRARVERRARQLAEAHRASSAE